MDIEVRRAEPSEARLVQVAPPALGENQVRLTIERFGLSTNNVTYAFMGDFMKYWDFFPTADPDTWGRVPVWGFATVAESRHADVPVGERLFGYLPMSDELVITAGRVSARTLSDVSEHRAHLPGAYNSFARCAADPIYRADRESVQMLLFPLFFTSFVIDDFLSDNDDFGAAALVISSASSKTSIGVAHLAKARGRKTVGLTSPANIAFTRSLGLYDVVVAYADVASLPVEPAAFIDVAGNAAVVRAVHDYYGDKLAHSMVVGATQIKANDGADRGPLPGPKPAFLFAPTQIAKRTGEWGADELNARVAEAWDAFAGTVGRWMEVEIVVGPDEVVDVFSELVAGEVDPRVGFVCTLDEGEPTTRHS